MSKLHQDASPFDADGTLPDGYVAHLPPPKAMPPRRHVFGDPVSVKANLPLGRCQQTERTCKLCGVVKVTVHGPSDNHFRAWRKHQDAEQIETFAALPCEPKAAP